MNGATARLLPGGRLHLQHGPIDLVIGAWGAPAAVEAAFRAAAERFSGTLPALCAELPLLRAPLSGAAPPALAGPVARRMAAACWPHRHVFITPMAAVAGAVADDTLAAMTAAAHLDRAYVNNGGDIALHLTPGAVLTAGLVADLATPAIDGTMALTWDRPVRGLATSGWRGRSQSLGIADAATVLAASAVEADAAATMVANAVDVDHPAVRRLPARAVKDDSDLGDLPVTVGVGPLPDGAIRAALAGGVREAERLCAAGLIHGAVVALAGRFAVVGPLPGVGRIGPGSPRPEWGRAVS